MTPVRRSPDRALVLLTATLAGASTAFAQDSPTVPVYEEGQAQVVEGFSDPDKWIQHDLWVEAEFDSDGDGALDRMHVDVTRPEQTDTEDLKVAVIYETSPYYAGTGTTNSRYFWDPKQEVGGYPPLREPMPEIGHQSLRPTIATTHIRDWVPRGFAVMHSSSPGTGLSQGCPTTGGDNESLAPKAVIDWLNGRAKGFTSIDGDEEVVAYWTTGRVGMTGTSYNGTLPCAVATTGVEGLGAIIPVAPLTSYYHYYRSNGLVRHPDGYMGEDIDVIYDFINSGFPEMREYCNEVVRDTELLENHDRITGDYNDWWEGRNYRKKLANWKAATLMAHAWNDWNVMPEHSVLLYAALKEKGVPTQAYFHQGAHGGPPPLAMMNRWFTRYVVGIENGVEDDPRSWIVRENDERLDPTPYAEYPHPDAAPVRLHLSMGGKAVGGLHQTLAEGQGTETLVDDVSIAGAQLASAEESPHRLLYSTAELTEDLHLSGTARIKLRMSASAPAVNLSVWVVSLPWEQGAGINSNIITRGWADPQNAKSVTRGKKLKPDKEVELAFDLQPDDQVIPAGQSIGLMVFSSDRDFTLWPPAGSELTLDLDGTSLELPVVGGAAALDKALGGAN